MPSAWTACWAKAAVLCGSRQQTRPAKQWTGSLSATAECSLAILRIINELLIAICATLTAPVRQPSPDSAVLRHLHQQLIPFHWMDRSKSGSCFPKRSSAHGVVNRVIARSSRMACIARVTLVQRRATPCIASVVQRATPYVEGVAHHGAPLWSAARSLHKKPAAIVAAADMTNGRSRDRWCGFRPAPLFSHTCDATRCTALLRPAHQSPRLLKSLRNSRCASASFAASLPDPLAALHRPISTLLFPARAAARRRHGCSPAPVKRIKCRNVL